MKRVTLATLSVFVVSTVALAQSASVSHNSNLRSGPSTQSKILETVPANSQVTIISKYPREGYVRVETADHAHVGWVLSNDFDDYDPSAVGEFSRFPEIRWLDRHHWVPTVVFGASIGVLGGWPAFLWGYVVSTVALYHGTFAINSLAHLWGTRRFDTPDESRNNFWLALVTLGEGWHNNHHYSPGSCRQGDRWWELDITYLVLKTLGWFGIVRDLRPFRRVTS